MLERCCLALFSVSKPAELPATYSVRGSAPVGALNSPNLAQRLASPPPSVVAPTLSVSSSLSCSATTISSISTAGLPAPQQQVQLVNRASTPNTTLHRVSAPIANIAIQGTSVISTTMGNQPHQAMAGNVGGLSTVTIPTVAMTGAVAAQGYLTDPVPPPAAIHSKPATPSASKSKSHKKKVTKKNTPVLPKVEQPPGNLPAIMPRVMPSQPGQMAVSQPQMIQNQQMLSNVISAQEVVYQAVDQQNPESKLLVKTLLAQKIRTGNVIIQQPVQGVMNVQNVDLGASGDSQTQTIQYQTAFPQNIQQAYIQYNVPATTTQTIIQQNQPTFVMQTGGGEMYVQGQLPTSSLPAQQQLISQQPIMVSQQPMMVSQQPMMVSQQPMMVSQQPVMVSQQQVMVSQQPLTMNPQGVMVSQHQFINQPQVIPQSHMMQQSQYIAQPQTVIPTSQVIIQPQSSQLASSSLSSTVFTTQSLSSTVSSVVLQPTSTLSSASLSSSTVTTTTNSSITDHVESASQMKQHSKEESAWRQKTVSTIDPAVYCGDIQIDTGQNDISKSTAETVSDSREVSKPSSYENKNNSAFSVPVSVDGRDNKESVELPFVEVSAEIESAVDSIMEESNDMTDSQDDEPVMIENDGNELMFEQQKFQVNDGNVRTTTELYVGDEAAMAVEQLEQMEHDDDDVKDTGVLIINSDTVQDDTEECDNEPMEVLEEVVNPNDQILNDQTVEMRAGSVDKDSVMSDEELIAKFRAETPINVPLVSENGLLEQDFEARMAVENLLKDVEFKVNDDDGEMNVIYACPPQQGNGRSSVKVASNSDQGNTRQSGEESDNKDNNGQPESQNTKSAIYSNHNDTSITSKPSNVISHPMLNGIDTEHKPLMNGDLSSPEYPSVPSPCLVNGREKLVNGISTEENGDIGKAIIDNILKMNGVVKHKISSEVQESKMIEVSAEIVDSVESGNISEDKPRTDDILAQSMIDSNIDKNEDSLDQLDMKVEMKTEEEDAGGDILARSIFENGIQPSDCEIPDPEPSSVMVKQILPNIMTVQINNNTIPITFTNNAVISNKNSVGGQINVCNSRHIPTPENARDGELSCDSSSSSIATSEQIMATDKHSMKATQAKVKDSKKSVASPKTGDSKKSKPSSKKRSRSKSGGSSGGESRPSSVTSAAALPPEFMCEWAGCRQ